MKKIFSLCCCLILLWALPALAREKERGGDRDERRFEDSRYEEEHDRGEHRGEYRSDRSGHHHKEAKRHKTPPPGWRKKINRGKRVDDSIYVYLEPPTPEVIAVLPPPPPGVSFRQIEDQIVKINDLNRQILEVLPIPKLPRLPLPPLPR